MSAAPPRAPRAFELMKIGTQFLTEPDDRVALALLREYPDSPADVIRTVAESSLPYEAPEDWGRIERRLQLLDRMSAMSRMAAAMARAQAAEAELSARPSIERLREAARAFDASSRAWRNQRCRSR